jgi:hypothetical protein
MTAALGGHRRLTSETAPTAYRPANVRPEGYVGRRRAVGPIAKLRAANPAWPLGIAAALVWSVAAVMAAERGLIAALLPW